MFRHVFLALVIAFVFSLNVVAQNNIAKTANPTVDVGTLELQLKPLQLSEVETEIKAWMGLLSAKTSEISQKQIAARTAKGEALATLGTQITAATAEQAQLAKRLQAVLAAMSARGGDIESFEKYISASTGVSLDISNAGGVFVMATDWLISPDGGIALAMNIGKFLITLLVFKILAGILAGTVRKAVSRMEGASDLLRNFFVNSVRKVTFLIGLIVALSMLGVNVGPFLAAIGAAGFVIGFALQGTLSNFASGVMILIYRPYDLGQQVTVSGKTGTVHAMSLVSTTLRLPDMQTVIVPNNKIWGGLITRPSIDGGSETSPAPSPQSTS